MRKSVAEYLALVYPLHLTPDPDGGYVFEYPDLPGCLGQVDSLAELAAHAEEARRLWLETAYERGKDIPLPSQQEAYSGKILVRTTKGLHRRLVETAAAEGVSLNYYLGTLLAEWHAQREVRVRLEEVCSKLDALRDQLPVSDAGLPGSVPSEATELGADLRASPPKRGKVTSGV